MATPEREELVCREIVELVTDYLEGALPPDESLDLERHLVYCSWCRDYVEQMRTTIELTGRVEPEVPPSPLREQLVAAFRDWKRTRH